MIDDAQQTENQTHSARRELYEVYADKAVKPRYKKKLIESLDEIYGYDLAFLVGLIMRTEFSGNLNVISQSNEISGISFSEGKITRIDLNDKDTFMGELLIKDGFIDRAQLHELLQQTGKPLGELLIINKIATREQIINVLVKQMRLRLSKYINNTKYRVNFSESDVADTGLSISYHEYLGLAHDWVAGRFDGEWLKLHYMELSEGLVEVPRDMIEYEPLKNLDLSKDLTQTLNQRNDSKTFSKIFASLKSEKDQEYFLKCFHYGIMSGQITLKQDPQAEAHSDSILKNIYNACSKKTGAELVETLAHILKYKPTEIDAIFQAINNYIDTYTGSDDEMKNNMFRIVLEMISKKQFYYNEITKKYASQNDPNKTALINKMIAEIYRDLLGKNLFVAIDKLKKMNQYSSHTPKIKLYLVWAKALMTHQNNIKINIGDLERDFLQILPEDKDSAEYYYVKSILASLKKDENLAKSSYDQSTKMNPELKKYPPFKQTRSFIKSLFKIGSIVLLIGLSGLSARAQTASDSPAPAKAKLPFVYLNQYFSYKVMPDDSIQVNETNFNLNDMILRKTNNRKVEIEFKNSLAQFNVNPSFLAYIGPDQKMLLVEHSVYENVITVDYSKAANAQAICLNQKSDFTILKICKSLNPVNLTGVKSYTANNLPIEPEGTIILNDKSEMIQFNVVKNNNDFFNLETKRRTVLPAKINKPENSEDMDIQFVESGNSRVGWDEKVNLSQSYVPLKLDNLITLKQGIYFNNNITAETGISETYIDREKIQEIYFNKIAVEPIFVFNQLVGKSNTTDAVLNSEMGIGVNVYGDHYMDNGRTIFGSLSYYSTKLSAANENLVTNNVAIINPQYSLFSIQGGYKYNLRDRLNISGVARIQEDAFLTQASLSSVEISKSLLIMLGAVPDYTFLSISKLTMNASLGAFLIMPNQVPNSTTTELGYLLEGDLKASYKLSWGRLTGDLVLGNRSQKNDIYTYSDTYLTYKVGFVYLF